MSAIIDETCDIIFGHFRKLLLKQAFETSENNPTLSSTIIIDSSEFDVAISFFYNCRLQFKSVGMFPTI